MKLAPPAIRHGWLRTLISIKHEILPQGMGVSTNMIRVGKRGALVNRRI